MSKKQVNVRLAPATVAQLKKLQEKHGTQTEVLAVAIDRMYRLEYGDTASTTPTVLLEHTGSAAG